jgi:uncharacterized phage protein (TIGR01671 family)
MRPIKFRAIAISSGEFVYGNFIHSKRFAGCSNEFRIHDCDTGMESDIDVSTLGQFISAKDWRGRELYEGDEVVVFKKDKNEFKGVIEYSFQISSYIIKGEERYMEIGYCGQEWHDEEPDLIYITNVEIIGNIHQNKELLNQ